MPASKTFATLWSERHQGAIDDFENQMFWQCLHRHSLPLASLLIQYQPRFFREDFEFLRDVAFARTTDEVVGDLNRFYGRNVRDRSFLRRRFFIRVSGGRLLRVWRSLQTSET